jgi:hypothetical protein
LLSFGRKPATIEVAAKSTYTATFFIEKNAVRFRLVYGAEKYRGKDSKIHVHSPESSPASLIAIPVRYVPLESYHRRKKCQIRFGKHPGSGRERARRKLFSDQ